MYCENCGLQIFPEKPSCTRCGHAPSQQLIQLMALTVLLLTLVGNGLAGSLARPGGNVTGIANLGPELAAKNVELIRQIVPSANQIVVLANALDPFFELFVKQI